jgi:HEPN domain-containing protein
MSTEPNEDSAGRWLEFALGDLAVARTLVDREDLPHRVCCFHCQQAAEKALKALLIRHGIVFPRTHDLDRLLMLLPVKSRVRLAFPDLSDVSVWAVESRYPSDSGEASAEDARDAFRIVEALCGLIEQEFGLSR